MQYEIINNKGINREAFSKRAPLIKTLLWAATISQVISGLTEAFGMHTFFKQFIEKYQYDTTLETIINVVTIILVLFIATFFFGALKVKSWKTSQKIGFFLTIFALNLAMIYIININSTILGAGIGLFLAMIMEILIRVLVVYMTWEILTFHEESAKDKVKTVFTLLVSAVFLYFITDFSVNTSKKATWHAFWNERPERTEADLSGITANLEHFKAANLEEYQRKVQEAKSIAKTRSKAIKEAYAPLLEKWDNDIQYWSAKRTKEGKAYNNQVRVLKNKKEADEAKMQAELRPIELELASTLSRLLSEYESDNAASESDFQQKKTLLEQDAYAGTEDMNAFFEEFSQILATVAGKSVIASILCLVIVVFSLQQIGIKPSLRPSKEFFEGNVGGLLKEFWQYVLLKTVRDLRNALRKELGNLPELSSVNATSSLYLDWEELETQFDTKSVGVKKEKIEEEKPEEKKRSVVEVTTERSENTTPEKKRSVVKKKPKRSESTTRSEKRSVVNGKSKRSGVGTRTTVTTTPEVKTVVIQEGMPYVMYKGRQRSEAWIRQQIVNYEGFLLRKERNPETCKKNIEAFNKLLEDIQRQKTTDPLTD